MQRFKKEGDSILKTAVLQYNILDDLKQLTKFGLSVSVVFSSIAGYLLAADKINWMTVVLLAVGGYCMVGASNAFNQIIERGPDALMKRTMNRPIPTGRISVNAAMAIAVTLTLLGVIILYGINERTALFGAVSIFLYTSAYTPLKPITPLSVFVGAIPGAIPFMLGWVAATGLAVPALLGHRLAAIRRIQKSRIQPHANRGEEQKSHASHYHVYDFHAGGFSYPGVPNHREFVPLATFCCAHLRTGPGDALVWDTIASGADRHNGAKIDAFQCFIYNRDPNYFCNR